MDKNAIKTLDGAPVGSPVRQLDADTVKIDDQSYRLSGFNAPETAKIQGGVFIPDQLAGDTTEDDVNEIAREGGFTNLVPTGKRDVYNRQLADQLNVQGQNLGDLVTALGVTAVNPFTSPEVIQDHARYQVAQKLFPGFAAKDPSLTVARKRQERQLAEAGENPIYQPKMMVANEMAYAGVKNSIGIPAVKQHLEEVARLESILEDTATPAHIRKETEVKLEQARQDVFEAATTRDFVGGVTIRHDDRNMMNQARNQLTTSWYQGMNNIQKGLGGIAQIAGESAKWDWLAEKGKQEILGAKLDEMDMPSTLSSYKDINTNNSWEAITDTALYLGNNLASSLPQMAVMIGSGVALGATGLGGVAAFGASSVPGSLLYTGQYFADQQDNKKDPVKALMYGVSSGVLDNIGLAGMMGSSILTKAGRNEVISEMINKGIAANVKEADNILKSATQRELLEVVSNANDFAKQQLLSSQALISGSAKLLVGGGSEAGTETLQTIAEMLATTDRGLMDLQYEKDYAEKLINSAVAGGAIGGGFKLGGAVHNAAEWHSAADAIAKNKRDLEDFQQFNNEVTTKGVPGLATEDRPFKNITQVGQYFAQPDEDGVMNTIASLPANEGTWNGFKALATDPLRLVRGLADTVTPNLRNEDGTFKYYRGLLKAIMAGKGLVPGESYSGFKQRLLGQWSGDNIDVLSTKLNTNVRNTSKLIRDAAQNYWLKGDRLPENSKTNQEMQAWKDTADRNRRQMQEVAAQYGIELPELSETDFLLQSSLVRPSKIRKNKDRLLDYLQRQGASRREAEVAVNNIISGSSDKAAPAAEFFKNHGVYSAPELNDLFEPNIYASMEAAKGRIASRIAGAIYLGPDGTTLGNLLTKANKSGEFTDENEFRDAVKNVRDWYDIEMGNYNPMSNYPALEKVISWGTTLTMLAGLGTATLASMPEVAMSTLGTNGHKVNSQLQLAAKNFFREYRADFNKGISHTVSSLGINYARDVVDPHNQEKYNELAEEYEKLATNPDTPPEKLAALQRKVEKFWQEDLGRNLFERLGYAETSYNTQAKYELPNANMKKSMQIFAEIIGLRALTDGNRMAALSMAADAFVNKLTVIQAIPDLERSQRLADNENLSNEQYQAVKELTSYGMDVNLVLDYLEAKSQADGIPMGPADAMTGEFLNQPFQYGSADTAVRENILAALGNFVDSKIVNPQPHVLPKYYFDPRFRLVTAMTRFIAAATTTVLPNLYMNYIAKGSAAMRYQAFSVIALALLFAAIADGLKDELKYGEANPWIRGEFKRYQRTVGSSGLLGKGEVITNLISPLYPDRKTKFLDSPGTYVYDQVKGTSPVVSWADRAVSGMYNVTSGDQEKGTNQIFRSLPVIGSFPKAARDIAESLNE